MVKVITYGTFDLFHQGHYNILKRAKEAGDYLIVGVTGEAYDAERGKLSVHDSLATRIENVRKTGFADLIIVEEYLGQKIQDIMKYDVDVLVIGSDWKGKFDHLNKYCEVRYLERTKNISSTQIRNEQFEILRLGIVTDDLNDKEVSLESTQVSGIHLESVFCEDREIADGFCEKYELAEAFTDYDKFLDTVDIVYIKAAREKRKGYVERAISAGKHVVCEPPFTLDPEEDARISKEADDKGVVFLNNVTELYLQAFGQLSWMARGNLIGDLVSIKCSISRNRVDDTGELDFIDVAYWPICIITKLLGSEYKKCDYTIARNEQGDPAYGIISIEYDHAAASVEIGMDVPVEDGMLIIGTEGKIFVPDNWWNIGYFKMKKTGDSHYKRYSSNFDGNGFRYLIQALLHMIKNDAVYSARITPDESKAILKILNQK